MDRLAVRLRRWDCPGETSGLMLSGDFLLEAGQSPDLHPAPRRLNTEDIPSSVMAFSDLAIIHGVGPRGDSPDDLWKSSWA